jgi:hypothetical protein
MVCNNRCLPNGLELRRLGSSQLLLIKIANPDYQLQIAAHPRDPAELVEASLPASCYAADIFMIGLPFYPKK